MNGWTKSLRRGSCIVLCGVSLLCLVAPARPAAAQTPSVLGSPARPVGIQGFIELAPTSFSAVDSFEAVFGSSTGTFVGGGARVAVTRGVMRGMYFEGSAHRFVRTGERVFVFDGEVFRLGIPSTLTITPVLATVGYRVAPIGRIVPYGGGGAGTYGMTEQSDFAGPGDDTRARLWGYHVLGGVEVGMWRFLGAAVEARWSSVPDALGFGGVAGDFGEDNLGGTSVRLRLLVGF